MGYSTVTLIRKLLANALTSATPDTFDELGNLLNVGNSLDTNLITTDILHTYMQDADQTIDSAINGIYVTPLKRVGGPEWRLSADVSEYADGAVLSLVSSQASASVLLPGDALVIYDGDQREEVEVDSVSGDDVTLASPALNLYSLDITRVVRVDFPAQIKFISARLAAANIYDKYFAAQADKNESKYGQFFREMAIGQLNQILAGATILHGQHRIGHLTVNPNLIKAYGNPAGWNDRRFELKPPGRS
jgi:hypothetical protein